jgi:RNA polymerase sigma factor (TIGR02999 family)
MRRILLDHARRRRAEKRGGEATRITLDEAEQLPSREAGAEAAVDVVALHEALDRLAALDPDRARLVELRFFSGLSLDEVAVALGSSVPSVTRQWRAARAWLARELKGNRRRGA